MVSSRDKLKERGLVQIAVWLSQDSAALLKRLASERGLSATKVVEQGIMALAAQPDEPATSAPDVSSQLAELAAALERTNERLSALEAPRAALAPATDAEPSPESNPAKIATPAAAKATPEPGKRRQKQPERDAEIIRLFNAGVGGSPTIAKALFDVGICNSKGGLVDTSVILDVLKKAGLR